MRASNRGASACYLDGFATVRLVQGDGTLDLKIGTTSSEQPGMAGRPTRVGVTPGQAARLLLFWRGYGAAADNMKSQTMDVVLRSGVAAAPVKVPSPLLDLIDLIDGGELPGRELVADALTELRRGPLEQIEAAENEGPHLPLSLSFPAGRSRVEDVALLHGYVGDPEVVAAMPAGRSTTRRPASSSTILILRSASPLTAAK